MIDFYRRMMEDQPREEAFDSVINTDASLTIPEGCLMLMVSDIDDSESMVLTKSICEGRICLYTLEDFARVKEMIHQMNKLSKEARMIERRVVIDAERIQIDNSRTLKLSPVYLSELGIDSIQNGMPIRIFKYPNRLEFALGAVEITK